MPDVFIPLLWFAAAASFTPGPNNIMVAASGANYGYRRTLPHMLGIVLGFTFMIAAVGFGLGEMFKTVPQLHTVLKALGTAYMIYLAWRIANAARPKQAGAQGRPFTFFQAALFQWVNPKAWMMGVSALTAFTTGGANYLSETLLVTATFFCVSMPSVSIWCLFGTGISRFLKSERALAVFNWAMAGLIIISIGLLYS